MNIGLSSTRNLRRFRRSQRAWTTVVVVAVLLAVMPALPGGAANSTARQDTAVPAGFALDQTRKLVSTDTVLAGETLTYTIELVNSGAEALLVWVADPIPELMTYVPGSASHNGEYHADRQALTWEVNVGANSTVSLSFQVTAGAVTTPTQVINRAAISSVYQRFMRVATVTVLPEGSAPPPAVADLEGSRKLASQASLAVGETMTYTIELVNSGDAAALVTVTDPIPARLMYVAGSASNGGVYAPNTETLTWSDVPVAANATVALTFRVTAQPVAMPTVVTNRALITSGNDTFVRHASILVTPESSPPPPDSDLSDSQKLASTATLRPGDPLTYTIRLVNSGNTAATVDVADQIPDAVTYVDGSVSAPGVYNAASQTLTWDDVIVPAASTVDLSFRATADEVQTPTPVINHAAIASDNQRFIRTATVLVAPEDTAPPARPVLLGSRKVASQRAVTGGDGLTYTINLVNSGAAAATVAVVDPLPAEVAYVEGSASAGVSYDAASRTLRWTDVVVPAGETVALTFDVTTVRVEQPTPVANTAIITSDDHTQRLAVGVLLLPSAPPSDVRPPKITNVRIAGGDVLTDPDVMLLIAASDDTNVRSMKIQEWFLATVPVARWQIVETTDWLPFQPQYPWTLSSQSGAHYVGVWVADNAGNTSLMGQQAMDFASLILPGEAIDAGQKVAYLVQYEAGAEVSATLQPLTGDADLYVWYPNSHGLPDAFSNEDGSAVDQVSFTAPRSGRYLFVVHGYTAATYNLSIVPNGGGTTKASISTTSSTKPVLTSDSILTSSGVDPAAEVEAPRARLRSHLPLIIR